MCCWPQAAEVFAFQVEASLELLAEPVARCFFSDCFFLFLVSWWWLVCRATALATECFLGPCCCSVQQVVAFGWASVTVVTVPVLL